MRRLSSLAVACAVAVVALSGCSPSTPTTTPAKPSPQRATASPSSGPDKTRAEVTAVSACRRPGSRDLHRLEPPAGSRRLHGVGEAPVRPGPHDAGCPAGCSTAAATRLEVGPGQAGNDCPQVGSMARGSRSIGDPRPEQGIGGRLLQGSPCPDGEGELRTPVTVDRGWPGRESAVLSGRHRGRHGVRRRECRVRA